MFLSEGFNIQEENPDSPFYIPKVEDSFTDKAFKAGPSSLNSDWTELFPCEEALWKTFLWKRLPIKFLNLDQISPLKITQGKVLDYSFVSVLSALSDYPEKVQNLYAKTGKDYLIMKISWQGYWRQVIVDSSILVQERALVSSGPIEWLSIIEKAWAKLNGSYRALENLRVIDVLSEMTGAPCRTISTNVSALWDLLIEAFSRQFIIIITDEDPDLANSLGLNTLYGYPVLYVGERNDGEKGIQVRNLWSDRHDEEMEDIPMAEKSLWISLEDLSSHFTSIIVSYIEDSHTFHTVRSIQKIDSFSLFEVSVKEPEHLYFGVFLGENEVATRMILAKVNQNQLEFINGGADASANQVWINNDVTPGVYHLYVKFDELEESIGFNLSVYSEQSIDISEIPEPPPDFIERVYHSNLEGDTIKLAENVYFVKACRCGSTDDGRYLEGYFIDQIKNLSDELIIEISVRNQLENFEFLFPECQNTYRFVLGPGQTATAIKKQKSLTEDFSINIEIDKTVAILNNS